MRKQYSPYPLALILISFILVSCLKLGESGLQIVKLKLNEKKITVELAITPQERQTGLMNRKEMDENHGMLFVFEEEEKRSFWMKNTYIPLSIAYINREGVIIDIKDMAPLDTTPVPSRGPAMYALEVNRGMFKKWGIEEGYILSLPRELKK